MLQFRYVPQMTSNGIDDHFNGVTNDTLIQTAKHRSCLEQLFEDLLVDAALIATMSMAIAFNNKAIGCEMHKVIGRVFKTTTGPCLF
jgi:hypothetical protein